MMLSLPPGGFASDEPITSTKAAQPLLKKRGVARPRGLPAGVVPAAVEQRAWPRAQVNLEVQVLRSEPGRPHPYVAENLSAGGALLTGGPVIEVGSEVRVIMQLGRRTMNLAARVMRIQADHEHGPGSAIRFLDVGVKSQDIIQTFVLTALRRGARKK